MSTSIKDLTIQRLNAQSSVPLSPGCIDEKATPSLCLGAALVASHIEIKQGRKAAEAFSNFIVKQASSNEILKVAKKVGFPVSLCNDAIAYNDGRENSARKAATINFLQTSVAFA